MVVALGVLVGCADPAAPRRPAPPAHEDLGDDRAYLTGSRLAAIGTDVVVSDEDSGQVIRADVAGTVRARRDIGAGVAMLARDPGADHLYVADRAADRVVVLHASTLAVVRTWKTPAEPYGVALTPERTTLLVTTIADRTLVAYDTRTGQERWRMPLPAGARGVSISPSGAFAVVASVAEGALRFVRLTGERGIADVPFSLECVRCADSPAYARGSGAVRILDDHHVVATFARAVPEILHSRPRTYGGGRLPPIAQYVAFFTLVADAAAPSIEQHVAQIADHQVRSIGWEARTGRLSLAGFGSDTLLVLSTRGSTTRDMEQAAQPVLLDTDARCGPDGAAVTTSGDTLVWCSFSRTVLRRRGDQLAASPPLARSALSPSLHEGRTLFFTTQRAVDRGHTLACSSCHLDGGSDGLSWRIHDEALQTPSLAGRISAGGPFKWRGRDPSLAHSVATTIGRLGGTGLAAEQARALAGYLAAMPAPRSRTGDAVAIARGRALFQSSAGCASCHEGPTFTDHLPLEITLGSAFITPSLVGVAASAPYYHDGSAATLDALLSGHGTGASMSDELRTLAAAQRADLRAYLESL